MVCTCKICEGRDRVKELEAEVEGLKEGIANINEMIDDFVMVYDSHLDDVIEVQMEYFRRHLKALKQSDKGGK